MDGKGEARCALLRDTVDAKKLSAKEIGRIRALAGKKAEKEMARYGDGEWDRQAEWEIWKLIRGAVWETAREALRRVERCGMKAGGTGEAEEACVEEIAEEAWEEEDPEEVLSEAFADAYDQQDVSWKAGDLLDGLLAEKLLAVQEHISGLSREERAEFLGLSGEELYGDGEHAGYPDGEEDEIEFPMPGLFHVEWEEDWTDYEAVMARFPDLFAYDGERDSWSLTEEGEKQPWAHGISAVEVLSRYERFEKFPEDRAGGRHTLTAREYAARGYLII